MLEKPLKCPNCGTHFFVDEVLNVQEHPKEAMQVECPNWKVDGYFDGNG